MSYDAIRKDYVKHTLEEVDCLADPITMLDQWLKEALIGSQDANAMTLGTISPSGYPESRVVLIRKLDKRGLIFFTNYESSKGLDIRHNPKVNANFFWPWMERQVRVKGKAERLSPEESDAYFASRPRESQLGAWASIQSAEMKARDQLEKRLEEFKEKFKGQDVPRPDHWGGYVIHPVEFEFWQGRSSRLHDRILYTPDGDGWRFKRLFP